MNYLLKSFTLPAAGDSVTQEQWDSIFGKRVPPWARCREVFLGDPEARCELEREHADPIHTSGERQWVGTEIDPARR